MEISEHKLIPGADVVPMQNEAKWDELEKKNHTYDAKPILLSFYYEPTL